MPLSGRATVPMSALRRRYGSERQLEVAIYAERTSDAEAAARFAIPRRTVTNIRKRWRNSPEMAVAKARLAATLADQYAHLEQLGIARARQALDDPETGPRDIARLLEVVTEQRTLLTGEATRRIEAKQTTAPALSSEEAAQLARFLDAIDAASDDELREWAVSGGLVKLRDGEKAARQQLADRKERDPQ
jgi:hypothetical protein